MGSPSNFTDEHYIPTAITQGFPPRVTITDSNFINGQRLRATRFVTMPFADATGMEQLNNNVYVVQQATADEFDLYDIYGQPIDGLNYTAFISTGLAQFTLTGPDLDIQNPAPEPPE